MVEISIWNKGGTRRPAFTCWNERIDLIGENVQDGAGGRLPLIGWNVYDEAGSRLSLIGWNV